MIYAALLRGINVGGNTKVAMAKLVATFESCGLKDVKTYINSGNIIFTSDSAAAKLEATIASAIERDFGFSVPVLLRDHAAIKQLCKKVPDDWTNDSDQKTDVMFLWPEIDDKDILTKITINPKLENVLYIPGAIVWNIARKDVTRGNGIKLVKSTTYKQMTVRNINTVRKLATLMEAIA